ncbi:MAG: GTP-binding protein [Cyanobacteria bacterium J06627_32]
MALSSASDFASTMPVAIDDKRLPVTIITGFLGSGKTTVVNHILESFKDSKVAVLVNEFGDINIDSQFIVQVEQDMIELTNGCICCSINDDLRNAVYRILDRRERIDYLVVETTGVADPLPITLTFLGTELRDLTRLDSILTMVDAESFAPDIFESQAAYSQIAYGDIIILNKTDLVTSDRLEFLEENLRNIKTGARILRAEQGKVPLPLIIDIRVGEVGAYQEKAKEKDREADLVDSHERHGEHSHSHDPHSHDPHSHDHSHSRGHKHHSDHLENDGFMSFSFECDRPFVLRYFQQFLDNKLPENVFRAKGVLWFKESPARHFFQLTGKRFQLEEDRWSGERSNQLVFIGKNINQGAIQQMLEDCVAPTSLPTT